MRKYRVVAFVSVSLVVVLGVLPYLLWVLVGKPEDASERISFIQTIGGFLVGASLVAGLYFTARNIQVNREGQITERFTRAIDQLGATDAAGKQLEIRLGGIYALERIAKDSEQDHWPIMEVLTAYVRQHSPRKHTDEVAAESEHGDSESTLPLNDSAVRVLDADTQAIITVIRRRTRSLGNGEPERLDLHGTHLQKANLGGASLVGADLKGASLRGADLREANLWGAVLWGADLGGAVLWGADLREAVLWGADLREANLERADLREAVLWGADLGGANLERADLREADLGGAMNLTQEQLESAIGNDTTRLPNHLEAPASWLE